jgi:hypothetical protein
MVPAENNRDSQFYYQELTQGDWRPIVDSDLRLTTWGVADALPV